MTHTESKECLYCKETFFPSRKDAKFCSSRCKHRHFLEKEEKNGSGTVSENVSEILQLEANRFQNVSGNQKTDAGNASETVKKRFPPGQFLPAIIEKSIPAQIVKRKIWRKSLKRKTPIISMAGK